MRKLLLTFILIVLGLLIFAASQSSFAADTNISESEAVSETETDADAETDASKKESSVHGLFKGYVYAVSQNPWFDLAILITGAILFIVQAFFLVSYLSRKYWATQNATIISELFLALCEVFPLLGLLGTVLGLLDTFSALPNGNMAEMSNVIKDLLPKFAPALTTTVSGMLAMIFNLMLCVFSWFCIQFISQEEK
ncbi:MAG: MotA/TolQ/ExbB proton channel family protein [Thermoguttaceae bacterium]|nr:MotA/TolQ/ExbB proton channel family protein [Thermoguttaceae bacterium]